jgi:hypothetical protein
MRDSVGALYIHGKEPNTDMITEEAYSPYFFKIKLDGKLTYEMKGTWELRNDFMSGPFINYAILDMKKTIVFFWRLILHPKKNDLMHQLESIIKSVSYLKSNCKLARVSKSKLLNKIKHP